MAFGAWGMEGHSLSLRLRGEVYHCRIEDKASRTKLNQLSYEEIIKGEGYETRDGTRAKKRWKDIGSTAIEGDSGQDISNSDMEQEERRRAERESACWFFPRIGKITKYQPEGVFQLVGINLNSASTKEVQDRKISDIHWGFWKHGMFREEGFQRLELIGGESLKGDILTHGSVQAKTNTAHLQPTTATKQ